MCSVKSMFLKISQNLQENTCARISFLIKYNCNFMKKGTLGQVLSCELYKNFKNTLFQRESAKWRALVLGVLHEMACWAYSKKLASCVKWRDWRAL